MSESFEPGMSLLDGMQLSGMTYEQLWLRHIGIGGDSASMEVEAYVLGLLRADDYQHDLIAQAINEHFIEQGMDHPVAYSRTVGHEE